MAEQTLLEKALAVKDKPNHISQLNGVLQERLDLVLAFTEGKITAKAGASVVGMSSSNFRNMAASTLFVALKRGLIDVRRAR